MIEESEERHGQALRDELQRARGDLETTVASLHTVDARLDELEEERGRFVHLESVCTSLEKLEDLGAADLFWRASEVEFEPERHLAQVRARIATFEKEFSEIEFRREELLTEIDRKQDEADWVAGEILELERKVEERENEWEIERDPGEISVRPSIMPWARGGEEDERFRKTLGLALLLSLVIGLFLPMIDIPIPARWEVLDEQERLTQLIREERIAPPPSIVMPEPQAVAETEPETEPVAPSDEPVVAEATAPSSAPSSEASPAAKKRDVATRGLLAFSEQLSGLARTDAVDRLGSNARILDDGEATSDLPARSMVASQAAGSSGGINVADLSRGSGGTGNRLDGVAIARATSAIGTGGGGNGTGDRPLAGGGPSASRTDEEIQIVFDRHKAALYRLYNRALRSNPTLRGQIVLRLTIEPNGTVSFCEVKSSDMKAPELANRVVERVKTFDFGAKDDIPPVTIVYPIDFLPAS